MTSFGNRSVLKFRSKYIVWSLCTFWMCCRTGGKGREKAGFYTGAWYRTCLGSTGRGAFKRQGCASRGAVGDGCTAAARTDAGSAACTSCHCALHKGLVQLAAAELLIVSPCSSICTAPARWIRSLHPGSITAAAMQRTVLCSAAEECERARRAEHRARPGSRSPGPQFHT